MRWWMHPEGVAAAAPWPAASSPQPGPSRLFTVTANNNGAVSAAINMLVAVQGLWIIWLICIRHDARPRSEPGANIRYGLLLS